MKRGFRHEVRRILPPWLQDRPSIGKTKGFRLIFSWMVILDVLMQWAVEMVQARWPTHGTPTALPYHGRDSGILRGPEQSDADYAEQCTEWMSYWRVAGNAWSLARSLQRYLGKGPRIRIVNRHSYWVTLNPDGSLDHHHATPPNWDWDSETHPELASQWWDVWVIVYPPHFKDAGSWGDGSVFGEPGAWGSETSTSNVETIKALVAQWKGAHTRVVSLILATDLTSFDPAQPPGDPSLPDGWWGLWSKDVNGVRVRSRHADARYWEVH